MKKKSILLFSAIISVFSMNAQNTFPGLGNVGIGTTSPISNLHLQSSNALGLRIEIPNVAWTQIGIAKGAGNYSPLATAGSVVFRTFSQGDMIFTHQQNGNIHFASRTDNTDSSTEEIRMTVASNGNVGIGKTNPTDKLEVNGRIHARSVKVDLDDWPDYVFEKGYRLKSLPEIEKFIKKNGHLENLPRREKVVSEGLDLGETNKVLVEKVEELTLHLIEKNREIQKLTSQIFIIYERLIKLEKSQLDEKNEKL